MYFHLFHKSAYPDTKGRAGPTLNFLATLVGVVAPFNAIPQIIEIFKNQSVANVSLLTYLIVFATQLVWLVYGIKLSLRPLQISSVVVILLSGIIIFQFFIYG